MDEWMLTVIAQAIDELEAGIDRLKKMVVMYERATAKQKGEGEQT